MKIKCEIIVTNAFNTIDNNGYLLSCKIIKGIPETGDYLDIISKKIKITSVEFPKINLKEIHCVIGVARESLKEVVISDLYGNKFVIIEQHSRSKSKTK